MKRRTKVFRFPAAPALVPNSYWGPRASRAESAQKWRWVTVQAPSILPYDPAGDDPLEIDDESEQPGAKADRSSSLHREQSDHAHHGRS